MSGSLEMEREERGEAVRLRYEISTVIEQIVEEVNWDVQKAEEIFELRWNQELEDKVTTAIRRVYDRSRFQAEGMVSKAVIELMKLPDFDVYQKMLESLLVKLLDNKKMPEASSAGVAAAVRGDEAAADEETLKANGRLVGMAMTLKGADYWEKRYGFNFQRWFKQFGVDKRLDGMMLDRWRLYSGREMNQNSASFWIRLAEELVELSNKRELPEYINEEVTWAGVFLAELPVSSKRNLELIEISKKVNCHYLETSLAENEFWPRDWEEWLVRTLRIYAHMKGGSAKSRQVVRPYVRYLWEMLAKARYHGNKDKPIEDRASDLVMMLEHLIAISRPWLNEKSDSPEIQMMGRAAGRWVSEYEQLVNPRGVRKLIKAEPDVAVFGAAWKTITKK